jgi:hypothetical protein
MQERMNVSEHSIFHSASRKHPCSLCKRVLDVFCERVGGVLQQQQADFGEVLVRSEMQGRQIVPAIMHHETG